MKIKITDIHPEDSFYSDKDALIGVEGEYTNQQPSSGYKDYMGGRVNIPSFHPRPIFFYAFKYEELDSTNSPENDN